MIDWNRVTELRGEIGIDDFDEVVEIFLEEVDGELAKLREHAGNDGLESALHFLKGSALNLGFTEFSDLCQKGETAAESGSVDEIDLSAIFSCYDRSKTEFLNALSNLNAA